jgi:hypothetical protein
MSRVRAHVGTSLSPTATGNRAVTGVGFRPNVVLPFGGGPTADGTVIQSILGFGAGTSPSSRASVGVISVNGLTTSSTERRHANNSIVGMPTSGANHLVADLNALGSDGFTLNWSTVQATERILNHICLGGADLEVSLTQHQMNATNAPQSFAHGLSGAPTGLMFFSVMTGISPPFTTVVSLASFGLFAGGNQITSSVISNNAVTTTATSRRLATTGVLDGFSVAPNVVSRQLAVSSVDATHVNCTYPVTASSAQFHFWMLAIRGARCQVGTFDCNGSLSPLTISTPGITPRLFLPVFVPSGVDNVNTVQNGLNLAIGACDGTRNVSCGITDENGRTGTNSTNARRFQNSSAIEERNNAGTSVFSATVAFVSQSVVLTPTVNSSSTYGQGGYLIIGESPYLKNNAFIGAGF